MTAAGRVTVTLWLISLAGLIGVILRTPFTTDMSAFLPSSPTQEQQVLVDQLRDGITSRLILIGIEQADQAARAGISRRVAQYLRGRSDFVLVDNAAGSSGKADQAYVWRNRYVLSPKVAPERFTVLGLRRALAQDLDLLSSSMEPLLKDSIARDPTGEALTLARAFAGAAPREIRDGVWTSRDGSRALVLAETRAPGFDIDAQEKATIEIRAAFAAAQSAVMGGANARLLMSGPGVFGVQTRAAMKHDVSLYSTIAVAVIVGLLLALYRSPVVLGLTLVPVVSGALAGLVAVSLWFGFVHGVTLGFGVTLIGESVDYAIYLFVQSKAPRDTQATLQRIWPTLRIGVLVSICGFSVMLFSSFIGFVQLGIFTMVGLAVALCVTRFILPHLIPPGFVGTKEIGFASALLESVHQARRLRLPLVIVTVGAVVLILMRSGDLWQDELSSMSPISATDQQRDRALRRDIGAPDVRHIIVATAASRKILLETCDRMTVPLEQLVSLGVLSGYDYAGQYLPSDQVQQWRKAALPDREALTRNLATALIGTPFRVETFAPFLDEVTAAKSADLLTDESLEGSALSLKFNSLLIERPGGWVAIMTLHDVADPSKIAVALAGLRIPSNIRVELLDLKVESDRLLHRYRHEALLLAALGSVAIAALLVGYFRSLRQSIAVLAPLGAAVIVTVALLTQKHGQLSIFNIFGLLLVVAVGSNYCLFFQRRDLLDNDGARTVTSLLAANICTVVGFGALSLSRIPILYGIGRTVAIGTALSLLAAAILAPRPDCVRPPARALEHAP